MRWHPVGHGRSHRSDQCPIQDLPRIHEAIGHRPHVATQHEASCGGLQHDTAGPAGSRQCGPRQAGLDPVEAGIAVRDDDEADRVLQDFLRRGLALGQVPHRDPVPSCELAEIGRCGEAVDRVEGLAGVDQVGALDVIEGVVGLIKCSPPLGA